MVRGTTTTTININIITIITVVVLLLPFLTLPCRFSSTHLEEASPSLSGCTRQVCTSPTYPHICTRLRLPHSYPHHNQPRTIRLAGLPLHCHRLAEASAGGRSAARCLMRIHYAQGTTFPFGRMLPRSLWARRCPPPAPFIPNLYPVLSQPKHYKLTYSPSCSLATSLAQRTSRSGSTFARKPTLVHQAEMTRTWALSRSIPSLPISLSWLVPHLCTYPPEVYNHVAEHLRPVVRPRRWHRPDPDHCHLPTLDGTHTFHLISTPLRMPTA